MPEKKPRGVYSSFQICKKIGIKRERLKNWMDEGFVSPTVPAKGQGKAAIFTEKDLRSIKLFKELIEFGLTRKLAKRVVGECSIDGEFVFRGKMFFGDINLKPSAYDN